MKLTEISNVIDISKFRAKAYKLTTGYQDENSTDLESYVEDLDRAHAYDLYKNDPQTTLDDGIQQLYLFVGVEWDPVGADIADRGPQHSEAAEDQFKNVVREFMDAVKGQTGQFLYDESDDEASLVFIPA